MTEKRFTTNGYYIYDNFKEDEWLVNEVEVGQIVDKMNNLDLKARERSKALSKLQKENEQLKHDATVLIQSNTDYRKENEELKKQLNDITLNWTQNHTEFDKDELYVKDNNTEIILKGRNLFIQVFIPQIQEYFKFNYIVTGRRLEKEYNTLKGDYGYD